MDHAYRCFWVQKVRGQGHRQNVNALLCDASVEISYTLGIFGQFFFLRLPPVKAKDAICNPVVMSVRLSVCNWNAWAKNL